MKITLEIQDHKVPFFMELLKNFQDFVSIEDEATVAYSTTGKPLNAPAYIDEVMRGYKDVQDHKTSTSEELIERAKSL